MTPCRIHKVPSNSSRNQWIYLSNSAREEVLGVGTYQLKMQIGRTLILFDVLYAPRIQRNLLSVFALTTIKIYWSNWCIDCT